MYEQTTVTENNNSLHKRCKSWIFLNSVGKKYKETHPEY